MSEERWVATGIPDRVLIGDGHVLIGPAPLVVGENACYFGFGAGTGALNSEHWLHFVEFENSYQKISWQDFTQNSALVGDAVWIDGSARLTRAAWAVSGNVWMQEPIRIKGFGGLLNWRMYFEVSMGGGSRADGLALILQSTATGIGGGGGGMGYEGIANSVAVGYDIYRNPWDPNNNHVEINVNGVTSASVQVAAPSFQLWTATAPGTKFYNWIDYDGGSRILSVFASNLPAQPASPLISQVIDLGDYVFQT